MALLHDGDDIASDGAATSVVPWATRSEVAVLFGNLAGLWLGIPALRGQTLPLEAGVCGLLSLAALWFGLGAPAGPARLSLPSVYQRHVFLLAVAPALLALGAGSCWATLGPGAGPGALSQGLSVLGLWAYAATCLRGDQRRAAPPALIVQSMDGHPGASARPKRPLLLGLLYGMGALLLASHAAPSGPAPGTNETDVAWHLLTAASAAALAVTVAGLHLGTALRRPRVGKRPLLPHVLVVITGLMTYLILLRLGG